MIGQRIWRGEVHDTAAIFVFDQKIDGADEVGFVKPGDELAAGALGSAEASAHELHQNIEGATGVGAHDNGGSHGDFTCAGSGGFQKRLLPIFGDGYGKIPSIGRTSFGAPQFAVFTHGAVKRVAVDGGGAGIQPDARRRFE